MCKVHSASSDPYYAELSTMIDDDTMTLIFLQRLILTDKTYFNHNSYVTRYNCISRICSSFIFRKHNVVFSSQRMVRVRGW